MIARSLELDVRERSTLQRVLDRAPTYLEDFRTDPSWLPMFVFGRTVLGRHVHRQMTSAAGSTRARPSNAYSVVMGPTACKAPQAIVQSLEHDGYFDRLSLPDDLTRAIRAFADETRCFGNYDRNLDCLPAEHIARRTEGAPVTSGHYFERAQDCPAVMTVQRDPLLNDVARAYLGGRSQVISTRLWWSFPAPQASTTGPAQVREMLHFDLDDWRMLKFFFYLTPVDADSGPHLYVRGTHRQHSLKHQLSLTVSRPCDEVLETYGADRLTTICGEAGSGFVEDPFGFHAGSLARTTPRLMLEVGFGVSTPSRRRFFGEQVVRRAP